jgi:Leucine-rich repeat (LRR) protein
MPVINGVSTTHENLIPALLLGFKKAWRYQTPLHKTINLEVDKMRGVQGEVLQVNFAEDFTVQDVAPSAALPPGERQQWYQKEIKLQHWKEVRFQLMDRHIADGFGSTGISTAISSAATSLARHLNNDIIDNLRLTGNVLVTSNTPVSSYNDVINLNKAMSMRTPTTDRVVLFGREAEAALLAQPHFLEANYHAPGANITQGVIGQRLGFNFMPMDVSTTNMTQEVVDVIKLTGVPILKANRDAIAVATSSVPQVPNTFFHPGNVLEVISIDGNNIQTLPIEQRILTVTKKVDMSNNTPTQMEFRVGHDFTLLNGPISNLKVRMLKVIDEGFAYTKQAVSMVMRPSETLGFSDNRASVYDEGNQIAMTIERQRGHKITFFNSDILYGLAHVLPEYSVRQIRVDPVNTYV